MCVDDLLASGSSDGTVRVWSMDSLECVRSLESHTAEVNCIVAKVCTCKCNHCLYMYLHVPLFTFSTGLGVHVHVPPEAAHFFLGKVTALGVLCFFALFVCLTLLASFFLPSHLSFKNMHALYCILQV